MMLEKYDRAKEIAQIFAEAKYRGSEIWRVHLVLDYRAVPLEWLREDSDSYHLTKIPNTIPGLYRFNIELIAQYTAVKLTLEEAEFIIETIFK